VGIQGCGIKILAALAHGCIHRPLPRQSLVALLADEGIASHRHDKPTGVRYSGDWSAIEWMCYVTCMAGIAGMDLWISPPVRLWNTTDEIDKCEA
jgi:hypothetical protein